MATQLKNLMDLPLHAQRRLRQAWRLQGNTLVLRLPPGWPESAGVIHWWLHGDQGLILRGQTKDLAELPEEVIAANTLIWTPAADTLLTSAELPTRSRAKIQQALPYALEEQLLGEPESLHFAHRSLLSNRLAVAVTARKHMQTWCQALKAAGIQAVSMSPATLAVPLISGQWSMAYTPDQAWLRTSEYSGFACPISATEPPAMLVTALKEAREKQQAPEAITVFAPPAGLDAETWSQALGIPVSLQKSDFWIERVVASTPLNQLQGEFAPAGQTRELASALRPAAIILGVWLVGSLAFTTWEWGQLNHARESVRQEMKDLLRRTIPGAKVTSRPAHQMKTILAELQGGNGARGGDNLLQLLGSLAPVIQTNPRAKLRSVQYADAALTIEIGVSDFKALESIKNALASRDMHVEVLGANSGASGVEGRIRVRKNSIRGTT